MPQLVAFIAIGAGLYAGYRWVAREFRRVGQTARAAEEAVRRRATAGSQTDPRDLGALEWDERAQVYRPKRKI